MSDTEGRLSTCDFNQTGVCAFHNVEVERRRNSDEMVKNIPKLLTITNRLLATVALIMTIIGASFLYTRDTGVDSVNRDVVLENKLSSVIAQVSSLSTAVRVSEAKHEALVSQLATLNGNLSSLIVSMHKDRGHGVITYGE